MVAIITPFQGEASLHAGWTEALFDAIRPAASGAYANFHENEGDERVRDAYPTATYARLADVKRPYDPANLFRLNQNIKPAR